MFEKVIYVLLFLNYWNSIFRKYKGFLTFLNLLTSININVMLIQILMIVIVEVI